MQDCHMLLCDVMLVLYSTHFSWQATFSQPSKYGELFSVTLSLPQRILLCTWNTSSIPGIVCSLSCNPDKYYTKRMNVTRGAKNEATNMLVYTAAVLSCQTRTCSSNEFALPPSHTHDTLCPYHTTSQCPAYACTNAVDIVWAPCYLS